MRIALCAVLVISLPVFARAQAPDTGSAYVHAAKDLLRAGLVRTGAYGMLERLTSRAPHRLSGSAGADSAVNLAKLDRKSVV
jgi:hypothetical protein